jgi:hypothetical protein
VTHEYKQSNLNIGFSMTQALTGVSNELEMAILRVVMFHIGRENAISRSELLAELTSQGYRQDDRTVRLAVSELRAKGIPLAGTGGIRGGYWILKDPKEADEYLKVELHDRGMNLLNQESAVRKSFDRWYPGGQLKLPSA